MESLVSHVFFSKAAIQYKVEKISPTACVYTLNTDLNTTAINPRLAYGAARDVTDGPV